MAGAAADVEAAGGTALSITVDTADQGVITATQERIALDRVTGQSVNCCGENPRHQGLTLKFPFDTKKQSYQFWDGPANAAFPAQFTGQEVVAGVKVYRFEQRIDPVTLGGQEIPGSLAGDPGAATVQTNVVYSNVKTIWVEPTTGIIVKGQQDVNQSLESLGGEHVLTPRSIHAAFRHQILVDDGLRHIPIRIEIDLHDLAGDLRRRTLGLADHRGMAQRHLAALDGFDLRRRNVDHDITPGGVSPYRLDRPESVGQSGPRAAVGARSARGCGRRWSRSRTARRAARGARRRESDDAPRDGGTDGADVCGKRPSLGGVSRHHVQPGVRGVDGLLWSDGRSESWIPLVQLTAG